MTACPIYSHSSFNTNFAGRGFTATVVIEICKGFYGLARNTFLEAINSLRVVMGRMFLRVCYLKIAQSIIGLITVFMVDNFMSAQVSSKVITHYPTVQQVVFSVPVNTDVPVRTEVALSIQTSFDDKRRPIQPIPFPVHRAQTITSNLAWFSTVFDTTYQHCEYSTLDNIQVSRG